MNINMPRACTDTGTVKVGPNGTMQMRLTEIERSAAWCGVVWCGIVWYCVVWCGVVWCVVCGVWWCGSVRCGAV